MFLKGLDVISKSESISFAHAKLTSPVPRDPNSNGGNKSGPCGPIAKSNPTATFKAGETISVSWLETVNHPGRFIFSLSSNNDQNFVNFATIVDTQNTGGMHSFSSSIKLPDVTCDNCTLRMIQSMEENPNAPTYYSCADIKIIPAVDTNTSTQSSNAPAANGDGAEGSNVVQGSKFGGGGCGTIQTDKNSNQINFSGPESSETIGKNEILLLVMIPFFIFLKLRISRRNFIS